MGTQVETIICPDCGLVLREASEADRTTLAYDVGEWQRRCRRRDLDNPLWCLVQRDGTSDRVAWPRQEHYNRLKEVHGRAPRTATRRVASAR